jgi:hypothetical protein
MKNLYVILSAIVIAAFVGHLTAGQSNSQGIAEDVVRPPWARNIPADQRFVLLFGDTAVLDRETELIWEREPDSFPRTWFDAQALCNTRKLDNRMGWRLPRIQELGSLVDTSNSNPALPAGHPFLGVDSSTGYWSATTSATSIDSAWVMTFSGSSFSFTSGGPLPTPAARNTNRGVWCVRSDTPGADAQ